MDSCGGACEVAGQPRAGWPAHAKSVSLQGIAASTTAGSASTWDGGTTPCPASTHPHDLQGEEGDFVSWGQPASSGQQLAEAVLLSALAP